MINETFLFPPSIIFLFTSQRKCKYLKFRIAVFAILEQNKSECLSRVTSHFQLEAGFRDGKQIRFEFNNGSFHTLFQNTQRCSSRQRAEITSTMVKPEKKIIFHFPSNEFSKGKSLSRRFEPHRPKYFKQHSQRKKDRRSKRAVQLEKQKQSRNSLDFTRTQCDVIISQLKLNNVNFQGKPSDTKHTRNLQCKNVWHFL